MAVFKPGEIMEGSRSNEKQLMQILMRITDPRRRKVQHPLINILFIGFCAMVAGCDDFVSMAMFGESHRKWFEKYLDLSKGIPSHDRFNALFSAIKPEEFERCLVEWIQIIHEFTEGQVVAIDGKTLRRSFDKATGKKAIHMVSAWATENRIALGQVVTDEKSNEIEAIPRLLEILEIKGCLVTIDAMGCQVEIADKILDKGANYLLHVKGNQPALQKAIHDHFVKVLEPMPEKAMPKVLIQETTEKGHGREEKRQFLMTKVPPKDPVFLRWPHLKGIGLVRSETVRDGKTTEQVKYYIMSRVLPIKKYANAVRTHWGIENRLHWQLDVSFGEDACRVRKGNADINLAHLRRIAVSKLKNEKTVKAGVKNKRLAAGWNPDYILKVLFAK